MFYKGKRRENEEWISGYLYRLSENHPPFIMLKGKYGTSYEVDADSICRHTGFVDSEESDIYEYDILKLYDMTEEEYIVLWSKKKGAFVIATLDGKECDDLLSDVLAADIYVTAAGNILENQDKRNKLFAEIGDSISVTEHEDCDVIHIKKPTTEEVVNADYCSAKTNEDRIRTMSDEELAEFLLKVNNAYAEPCMLSGGECKHEKDGKDCKDCFLEYLKTKAKEE